jgi:hypothetical protein
MSVFGQHSAATDSRLDVTREATMGKATITTMLLLGSAIAITVLEPIRASTDATKADPAIIEETVQGKVEFVAAEANQLRIAVADRKLTVTVTPETRIRIAENREGTLANLRPGMDVLCVYVNRESKLVALTVLVLQT